VGFYRFSLGVLSVLLLLSCKDSSYPSLVPIQSSHNSESPQELQNPLLKISFETTLDDQDQLSNEVHISMDNIPLSSNQKISNQLSDHWLLGIGKNIIEMQLNSSSDAYENVQKSMTQDGFASLFNSTVSILDFSSAKKISQETNVSSPSALTDFSNFLPYSDRLYDNCDTNNKIEWNGHSSGKVDLQFKRLDPSLNLKAVYSGLDDNGLWNAGFSKSGSDAFYKSLFSSDEVKQAIVDGEVEQTLTRNFPKEGLSVKNTIADSQIDLQFTVTETKNITLIHEKGCN